MNNSKGMVQRFTKKERSTSEQISNDIAEGIDNKHSAEELRTAVAYYNDLFAVEAQKRAELQSKIAIFEAAKGLMDTALSRWNDL